MGRAVAGICAGVLAFCLAAPAGAQALPEPAGAPPAAEAPQSFEAQLNRDERQIVQRALVWLGLYDGWIDGAFGERSRAAIAQWQAEAGRAATGALTEDEVVDLLADGLVVESRLGWRTIIDPLTGMTIGLPAALLSETLPNDSGGTDYIDPVGSGVLSTVRLRDMRPGAIDLFYDLLRRSEDDGRRVQFDLRRGPLFILAGEWNGGGFYERYEQRGEEIRGYKLTWVSWETDRYAPIAAAITNSFYPFGGAPDAPGVFPVVGPLVARAVEAMNAGVEGETALPPDPSVAAVAPQADPVPADIPRGDPATPPVAPPIAPLPQVASGSGFAVAAEGWILTSAHVIEGCGAIEIGDLGPATIAATDRRRDLALLRAETVFPEVVPLRAGGGIELGEPVTVLGYPYRGIVSTSLTITQGIVSALAGLDDDPSRFQLSAAIQPGNSGGPVLDEAGRLIGVVVARIDDAFIASTTGTLPQNVNFGIRLELVDSFLLENGVRPTRSADVTPLTTRDIARRVGGLVHPVICSLE